MSLKSDILDYIKSIRNGVESREVIQKYGLNSSAALSVLFKNGSIIRKKLTDRQGFLYSLHPDMVQPELTAEDSVEKDVSPPRSFDEYWNNDGVFFGIKEFRAYMSLSRVTGATVDMLRDIMCEAFNQGRAQ